MVDRTDPSSQFHPYQPATETPVSERPARGISGMLRKIGIGDDVIERSMNKARDYARRNPGKVLGGLAAAVIGAGLLVRGSRSSSYLR